MKASQIPKSQGINSAIGFCLSECRILKRQGGNSAALFRVSNKIIHPFMCVWQTKPQKINREFHSQIRVSHLKISATLEQETENFCHLSNSSSLCRNTSIRRHSATTPSLAREICVCEIIKRSCCIASPLGESNSATHFLEGKQFGCTFKKGKHI